jgi:hypothetical protein
MRFLVIGIDPATGAAVSVLETVLPTRQEALSAVKQLASSEDAWVEGYDLYLVDLDAATPVLVVRAQAPTEAPPEVSVPPLVEALEEATGAEEPTVEDAFAVEAEPAVESGAPALDELAASLASYDAVSYSEPEAPAEAVGDVDDQALLDALRRAADSLVQQGIDVPAPPIQEAAVTRSDATPAPGPAPAVSEAPVDLPVAEPLGVVEPSAEPAGFSIDTVGPSLEAAPAAAEEAPNLEPVRPVIMGEYPEDVPAAAPPSVSEEAPEPEAKPYEPSGELEIGAYTCKDCVYFNTCPKAGESTPAECGTFQWRSF